MKSGFRLRSHVVISILTAILAIGTIALQVWMSRDPNQLTTLEGTLFSVLQFIFSLAFAWTLSRATFKQEFEDSQRKFAVAAYRRICEVDMAAKRLIGRIRSRLPSAAPDAVGDLQLLLAVATGIRQTARSSIADWADVIGDEISAMEQIEELKDEQDALGVTGAVEPSKASQAADGGKVATSIEGLEKRVATLALNLPPSLRVLAKSSSDGESPYTAINRTLFKSAKNDGFLDLVGFWEPGKGFDANITECAPGRELGISIGDVGSRIASIVVRNASGASVGVITNRTRYSYSDYLSGLTGFLNTSNFKATLQRVDRSPRPNSERVHFTVRVDPNLLTAALTAYDSTTTEKDA